MFTQKITERIQKNASTNEPARRGWLGLPRIKVPWNYRDSLSLLSMTIPALAILLVFHYMPMPGIIIAFKDYKFGQGIFASEWVGLANFQFLFSSGTAWRILRNTLTFNALFIVTGLISSVGLALLLNEVRSRYLARIFQSSVFFPYFISWVVGGYFAFAVLNSDNGLLNNFLQSIGVQPVPWYSTPKVWPAILVLANLWKNAGYNSIIYLAAMMGISQDYYEAASIDGASRWQQIRYITLPMLTPLITVLTLMAVGRIFYADFGLFYYLVRTGTQVIRATDVIDTYVFRALLMSNDVGMASSAAFFQSVAGFILILITNAIVRRVDRERALF